MISPGSLDLVAYRWTPYVYQIDFVGLNFTDATMLSHVRLKRDAPGTPIISLANASPSAEGLSVSVVTTGGVPTSTIQIRINEATLEGILLNAGVPGDDIVLAWDIHVTGGGYPKTRWLEGRFVIKPGVTA